MDFVVSLSPQDLYNPLLPQYPTILIRLKIVLSPFFHAVHGFLNVYKNIETQEMPYQFFGLKPKNVLIVFLISLFRLVNFLVKNGNILHQKSFLKSYAQHEYSYKVCSYKNTTCIVHIIMSCLMPLLK